MSKIDKLVQKDLLLSIVEPEYARVEFLLNQQKKSGYSLKVYFLKLLDVWQYWDKQFENEFLEHRIMGNNVSRVYLPISRDTDFEWMTQIDNKQFYSIMPTIKELSKLLNKHLPKSAIKSIQPIKWLKSEEALRQLIDVLKENGLIQSRDTEAIMQHFTINGKEPDQSKLEPINWISKKVFLAYIIETMANNKMIAVSDNIWQDTVYSHFLFNGKPVTNMRQTANNYKNNNKVDKPHKSDFIDQILLSLPD